MSAIVQTYWLPDGLAFRDEDGNTTFAAAGNALDSLPTDALPEDSTAVKLTYLPLELLLIRHIKLPLKSTKYLDADILLQELTDKAGIEPKSWWLTWHMRKTEQGIEGLVFGLPKKHKDDIQNSPLGSTCSTVYIDGWQRLNVWLNEGNANQQVAVVDTDNEGVFLGFYQSEMWSGIRRINGEPSTIVEQMLWSLKAMGFDETIHPVIGRVHPSFAKLCTITLESSPPEVASIFEPRYVQTLKLPTTFTHEKKPLNLRHDKWSLKQTSSSFKAWHRSAAMVSALGFIWLVSVVANNYQLESQIASMQDDIIAAFHQGLPNQTVMIDPLAQLRQAAGGQTGSAKSNVSSQLNALSQVFQSTPWEMQELNVATNGTTISGKVQNLDTLNKIRAKLSTVVRTDVQIADTELKSNEVMFRMTW